MSTNEVESVRPVIVVSSDPRGVDVDNGEEMVCSVGSSILCVTLTKVSLTRLGGYIRRIYSVHRVWLINTLMNYSNVVRLYTAV